MRESFRSTKPITEFAVNVLSRLSKDDARKDQDELANLGLIEPITRDGQRWLDVRYNQIHGPSPIFQSFDSRNEEGSGCRHRFGVVDTQEQTAILLVDLEDLSRPNDCVIVKGVF